MPPSRDHVGDFSSDERDCYSDGVSKEARENDIFDLQTGSRDHCLVGAALGQHLSKSSRSDLSHGIVPSFPGVRRLLQAVWLSSCRSVCNKGELRAPPFVCLPFQILWCRKKTVSAPMGWSKRLRFPSVHSSKAGLFQSDVLSQSLQNLGGPTMVTKEMVPGPSGSSGGRTSWTSHAVEPDGAAPCKKVAHGAGVARPTHIEVIKPLVDKASFCEEAVEVVTADHRKSTACLYQEKWSRFFHWCCGWNIAPCNTTVQQIA